jgi:hypothetical protein
MKRKESLNKLKIREWISSSKPCGLQQGIAGGIPAF